MEMLNLTGNMITNQTETSYSFMKIKIWLSIANTVLVIFAIRASNFKGSERKESGDFGRAFGAKWTMFTSRFHYLCGYKGVTLPASSNPCWKVREQLLDVIYKISLCQLIEPKWKGDHEATAVARPYVPMWHLCQSAPKWNWHWDYGKLAAK